MNTMVPVNHAFRPTMIVIITLLTSYDIHIYIYIYYIKQCN